MMLVCVPQIATFSALPVLQDVCGRGDSGEGFSTRGEGAEGGEALSAQSRDATAQN